MDRFKKLYNRKEELEKEIGGIEDELVLTLSGKSFTVGDRGELITQTSITLVEPEDVPKFVKWLSNLIEIPPDEAVVKSSKRNAQIEKDYTVILDHLNR